MDAPFIYDRYVTGKNFIGRKTETNILGNLLDNKENVAIYAPPKTGKMSLIQQTLFNMRISGKQFSVCQISLFNVRSLESFLLRLGTAVIRACATTPAEYEDIAARHLAGSCFTFDRQAFSDTDAVLTVTSSICKDDIRAIISLPCRISSDRGEKVFVIIEEFQNLLDTEGYEDVFSILKETMAAEKEGHGPGCNFVLTGSSVNAMKYIFEGYKFFHRQVEVLPIQQVEDKEIIEYIVKGFLMSGKVVEQDLILGACRLFRGNLWYLNHFVSICDSLTKGYINEGILMEALRVMISIHEPKFMSIMDNLTGHQISFVKAVMDGVVKFSSTEVIEKYRLNSSANVRRVKDALCKKEILTFNEREEPVILDPLFEYWLGKYYFEIL